MSAKKRILIVTDGTEFIQSLARAITNELPDYKTEICSGEVFAGTDLLPAETFFVGCEKPHPASFAYLTEMLEHINLAGRKCGVFSTNEKTLKYLQGLVKDCDAALTDPLLVSDGVLRAPVVKKWVKGILK